MFYSPKICADFIIDKLYISFGQLDQMRSVRRWGWSLEAHSFKQYNYVLLKLLMMVLLSDYSFTKLNSLRVFNKVNTVKFLSPYAMTILKILPWTFVRSHGPKIQISSFFRVHFTYWCLYLILSCCRYNIKITWKHW